MPNMSLRDRIEGANQKFIKQVNELLNKSKLDFSSANEVSKDQAKTIRKLEAQINDILSGRVPPLTKDELARKLDDIYEKNLHFIRSFERLTSEQLPDLFGYYGNDGINKLMDLKDQYKHNCKGIVDSYFAATMDQIKKSEAEFTKSKMATPDDKQAVDKDNHAKKSNPIKSFISNAKHSGFHSAVNKLAKELGTTSPHEDNKDKKKTR
jgi:hypothetical protein